MDSAFTLLELGWQPYFQQQLSLDDLESNRIARICSYQEKTYELIDEQGLFRLDTHPDMPEMTVGDWVVTSSEKAFIRRLDRSSVFDNIAANIDTVLIVCALDEGFNLPLIKRYLELAHTAQTEAIVVLTKADLCDDANEKRAEVEHLDPLLIVETVNAKAPETLKNLAPWLKKGKTLALLGAVDAGKSALIKTLMGTEDRKKIGTSDALQPMPAGALLMDTQGLRDLQIAQYEHSSVESFADIVALAQQCRFSNCHHQGEPGCAIKAAITNKRLDEQRVQHFLSLAQEESDDDHKTKSKPQSKFHRNAQTRALKHSEVE